MTALPNGIHEFLAGTDWRDAKISPLPGDASFRRYFRLANGGGTAMLMHAPPPEEDPGPFLNVARWLTGNGKRAPQILAADPAKGWILTEDFGDERVRERLEKSPQEEKRIYTAAVDVLADLHRRPPGPFSPYDMETYLREVNLLIEWYCPRVGIAADQPSWESAWKEVLEPLLERQHPGVTVLRDYHAENIMLPPDGGQGLIDFQDALVGHQAYDLVSLLQDARRDVSPEVERAMLDHYRAQANPGPEFEADYAVLGAQRNAKIVGIFTRLAERDGKPRYLALIPRVWRLMERDLRHQELAPVARWFDANIPDTVRKAEGAISL